mmetsp:Transcript_22887/g.46215  ORF Transcript_22887/g.46215 Transcript_22887/m.46215 type:complete len:270 (-) Transcript_22887:49-858(-)|eukprot:CAMPEP_0181325502 /NCGR_PEP_ID=MMETSP1101-20121128/20967_1 /TAXON_ID=46948 /ORGANISM="Rhodomonas abbreviata, Strain Caron Lab Isolate" /LENGTH=269 /DNA_ID=CAMNT_0023433829 /DNA_START=21 /DNA_END=830 /DNA_ORIENTATION=+
MTSPSAAVSSADRMLEGREERVVYVLLQQAVRVKRHKETTIVLEAPDSCVKSNPQSYSPSPLWNEMLQFTVKEFPCECRFSITDSASGDQVIGSAHMAISYDISLGFFDEWVEFACESTQQFVGKVRIGVALDRSQLESLKMGLRPASPRKHSPRRQSSASDVPLCRLSSTGSATGSAQGDECGSVSAMKQNGDTLQKSLAGSIESLMQGRNLSSNVREAGVVAVRVNKAEDTQPQILLPSELGPDQKFVHSHQRPISVGQCSGSREVL